MISKPDGTVADAKIVLRVDNLTAGYGEKRVIQAVSLQVSKGEIVLLIGHNGAGKSTVLRALFGLLPGATGVVRFTGQEIGRWSVRDRLRAGLVYVPQGGRVFTDLTVKENIEAGSFVLPAETRAERIDRALKVFPPIIGLLKRRAGSLSGGEQQMVSLARGLLYEPRLLMLDEPSLGLAPALVEGSFETIKKLRDEIGTGVLLVEQKVKSALKIADRVYILKNGAVSLSSSASELADERVLAAAFL